MNVGCYIHAVGNKAGGHTHLPKLIFTNSDVECTSRANDNTSKVVKSLDVAADAQSHADI